MNAPLPEHIRKALELVDNRDGTASYSYERKSLASREAAGTPAKVSRAAAAVVRRRARHSLA